jgi:AraC-like DNA-binding protein
MIYTSAITIAFLLALVLFTKRNRTKADGILAIWLVIMGVHLVLYYFSTTVDRYYYPYLLISFPFPLLHGPMLYAYTASLTAQHPYLKKWMWWHFLVPLFFFLALIPFYLLPHRERLEVFANQGRGYEWLLLLHKVMVMLSGVVYVVLSTLLLQWHKKALRHRFSYVEKINLVWLQYLTYGVGLVWLAVFYGNDLVIFSLVALFVLLLGYFGIKQVGIFTHPPLLETIDTILPPEKEENVTPSPEPLKSKYHKSTLTREAQTVIHQKLQSVLEEEKVFLNPELTLSDLADKLAVHPNHLSQVINSMESKTFYDYINGRRIEEFKKIVALPANQKYTLLAIAFECGFNSKTAFYRNFKNATGLSPTSYLKQKQIQIQADE